MTVMVAPTAMMPRAQLEGLDVSGGVGRGCRPDGDRMTRRISRGMRPTAAMPVPGVKPRPSDLARA